MKLLELMDISERYMELINPISTQKMITVGRVLGLERRSGRAQVIDFGSGFGEVLALWAEWFGIGGVGVEIRPQACRRAHQKMVDRRFDSRVEIVCEDAAAHSFKPQAFDAAICIGGTFIFGGLRQTIAVMENAVRPGSKLAIGEVFWTRQPPEEFAAAQPDVKTEIELLDIIRQSGYELEYIVRSSQEDWDRYESDNWFGLLRWLEENPDHPERQQVIDHLHESQEEYLRYGREYFGWAVFVLIPSRAVGIEGDSR